MTKIAELKDRGAVVAWSPLSDYADVLAMGSKVRIFLVRSSRVCGGGWRCVVAEAAGRSLGGTLQVMKTALKKHNSCLATTAPSLAISIDFHFGWIMLCLLLPAK